ncbi:lactate utilization protein [Proteiniclasticum sp. SCR006]|uniref:Lactate utilization protein n=1 Tax=Proteiniclasticum aestuarii TaxID=2817862 RepID=A0A939KIC3_9CLOT|nr:lactate utilization protein [Proteiniclasticum aestuarii]MBO1263806.1 lactate utilization protein [Proteiniclasticum aestuarii]
MDQHVLTIYEDKVERLIKNLESNNMKGTYLKSREELTAYLNAQIEDGSLVSVGGSQTLFELDLITYLRNREIRFLDRYKGELTGEEKKELYRKSFFADFYFSSSNAITVDGHLYNVDHTGNRVAALLYGPEKVFVIVGINKIVDSVEEAIARVRAVAAPANNVRLNRNTPCVKFGSCVDCKVEDRICNEYTLIKRQAEKNRIEVIILPFELGY